jgi:hypothetical protein
MLRGKCVVCGTTKTQFVKGSRGGDLVSSLNSVTSGIKLPWAKYPGEMHLPGMNFAGPGTRLDLRLNPNGHQKNLVSQLTELMRLHIVMIWLIQLSLILKRVMLLTKLWLLN